MEKTGCCDPSDLFTGRCFNGIPCLSDPVKRSTWGLRLGLVTLHMILVGFIFVFVEEFRENSKEHPWYTLIYMLLVVATLVQYYFTSGSSPGYVIDAMRDFDKTEASLRASEFSNAVVTEEGNQSGQNLLRNNLMNWTNLVMDMYPPGTSVRDYTCPYCNVVQVHTDLYVVGCCYFSSILLYLRFFSRLLRYVIDAMRDFDKTEASLRASEFSNAVMTEEGNQSGQNLLRNNLMNWTNLVMDMYPPGTSVRDYTCPYCNVVQPPRAKHCHDCKKCVLQFDHHCVWLGTCISQGNHCRFCERAMWVDVIMIMIIVISILLVALMFLLLLLIFHSYLVVTNQTTYEILRRRRIPYMRGIPGRVHPFSKGKPAEICTTFALREQVSTQWNRYHVHLS